MSPTVRLAVLAVVGLAELSFALPLQTQGPNERHFVVSAQRYRFVPARLEVFENDLVRIELRSEDIAHSLTVDDYRLSKRTEPGQPITFEFRAERPGTFPFYCDLAA